MHATYDQRLFNQNGLLLRLPMAGAPPTGPIPGPSGSNGTSLGPNRAPSSLLGPCEAHGRATHMARAISPDVSMNQYPFLYARAILDYLRTTMNEPWTLEPASTNAMHKTIKIKRKRREPCLRVSMTFRVVRTNQYNQDLGLIHSTNGNHLESPNEGSSIDHQVTIHLHAQNITMFPTNETWYFASQILVSSSGSLILILTVQSTRN
ncbi:AT-rich interactive domain-containing protein 3-like [Dorcoceras hygrometricum]|uniref:AT-rich interactive domain-containing protein 3-like n=1 Tax=Dorcoceras hygrometricum TaxID=472368 RepID=A0A2Z7A7W5_9LAMI|nr:AT-rich interactive domain-containing protein 3-like [Dorcoceras hygrometricum]